MRRKLKEKEKPKLGDVKEVVMFAWFPKTVEGHVIWLEEYYQIIVFKEVFYCMDDGGPRGEWVKRCKKLTI